MAVAAILLFFVLNADAVQEYIFSAASVIRSVGERHCNTVHKGAPFEVDVSMSTDGRANFLPDPFAIHVSSSNIQHHTVSKIVDTVRLSMHLICAKKYCFKLLK